MSEVAAARPGAQARATIDRHAALAAAATAVLTHVDGLRTRIAELAAADRAEQARAELAQIPLDRLAEVTDRNLRLDALAAAGYRTVADVLGRRVKDLTAAPGVGPATARAALAAAVALGAISGADKPVRLGLDAPAGQAAAGTDALRVLHRALRLAPLVAPHRSDLADYAGAVARELPLARPAGNRLRLALRGRARRDAAVGALGRLRRWEDWLAMTGLPDVVARLTDACAEPDPGPRALWADYERRSVEYHTLLEEVAPLGTQALAAFGRITARLAERVAAHPLDVSRLTVSLRGYQAFGARFALNQGRVLLGDEMGLGKTIQAIAVMAHLHAQGERHALVVCPASVLVNWVREVQVRSSLPMHMVHGPDRAEALARWRSDGGVAVTTYEGLVHVPAPDGAGAPAAPAVLVVDEAHFVKNPDAQRSELVARWAGATPRVLLMTGTPMENRVEEFVELLRLVQPEVAARVPRHLGLVGPEAFRQAVSPAYLRRNREDVLVELPDLVEVDEWVTPSEAEKRVYRAAVAGGSFMEMRRAGYATPDSAKLARLLEIVDDAAENGRRVAVFSYFRDVLDAVAQAVAALPGAEVVGPLTGDTPPRARQRMVDELSAARSGAVLVAQVQAGGVGLNIQAASVVVLCEPQLKPTTQAQAVGRVHRMGQVRRVVVHRLLGAGGVDERIVELCDAKEQLFDDVVRESAMTAAAVAAVDVSEDVLARDVVAFEQARLGYGPVWAGLADEGLLPEGGAAGDGASGAGSR